MQRIHIYLLAALCSLLANHSIAQEASRLRIYLDPITEQRMLQHGFEMDHGIIKKGVFVESDFNQTERNLLDDWGARYVVIHPDAGKFYRERSLTEGTSRSSRSTCFEAGFEPAVPENFALGTMGGFYTYDEFLANLDSMHSKYPELITTRQVIDTFLTHEGRPIYYVIISDNPSLNEGEPEVLYDAVHHAREPESLTQLVFYMWYLLENYGTDAEATHLVNQTAMYFVPMLNPDGYIYNQTTNPGGGGMWRKNRRNNGNNTTGVDLNRNYGYEWGYDNQGSSPNGNSETYRGPAAFSEPETRAMRWLCEQHEFRIAMNYHSFGNYVIYPWGFIPSPLTPDSSTFIAFAEQMTADNHYVYGTGYETVAYATNGDSDDWMYGEQNSKPKIFSMTPEVGNSGDGFWPSQSRIIPLAQENGLPNLLTAHMAGDYAIITDVSSPALNELNDSLRVEVKRLGLEFNGPYEFSIEAVSSNISSTGNALSLSSIDLLQSISHDFTISVNAATEIGDLVEFDLVAEFNGFQSRKRVTKVYGSSTVAIATDGFNGQHFEASAWGPTTEDFITADVSITDSPYSDYPDFAYNELVFKKTIDVRQSLLAYLEFQARWEIEQGFDYCQLLASPIESENWTPLCGTFTKPGTIYQNEGQPLWDGLKKDWVKEQIDLSDFIGQRIKLKLRFVSDEAVTLDGFYMDDFRFITLLDPNSTLPLDTSILAIPTQPMAIDIRVYPNPAQTHMYIFTDSDSNFEFTISDISGRLLLSGVENAQTSVDVHGLPNGVYCLSLSGDFGTRSQRLVIQR